MSEIVVSDELMGLVFLALDHGCDSVKDGGPLVPFVVTETAAGERSLARFPAETLEAGYEAARSHVNGSEAARAAIARDGYLTVDGERSDAVLVEAQERGSDATVLFGQRYRPGGRFKRFQVVGNAAYMGSGDPFL